MTFYDVTKAYDNVDNADLLKIVGDKGIRGKLWRILKNMNSELKAQVKTKFGLTREIDMQIGGRQGSRLTGRLFSKLTDLLAEDAIAEKIGFNVFQGLTIPMLLWIDDVTTLAEGEKEQKETLDRIDRFAKNHKFRWGQQKCQVMRIGKHDTTKNTQWQIGDMPISETNSYKYLGDMISDDGKNTKNIEARRIKTNATTTSIKNIASNSIFKEIGTPVLLDLHETITMSALLTNSESWLLNKGDKKELERIKIQAMKHLFNLPAHTPTPAIIFIFGLLYTSLRIEQRQLLYLWNLLQRQSNHWTRMALIQTTEKGIGWGKAIMNTLANHNLPTSLEEITRLSKTEWTRKVKKAIESSHKERLIDDLHKTEGEVKTEKTKTASIINHVSHSNFQREP